MPIAGVFQQIVMIVFLPLLLLHAIDFLPSTVVGQRFFDRGEGIALASIVQVQDAARCVKFSGRLFGPTPQPC